MNSLIFSHRFFLGILLGSMAGYFGGRIDWVINRVIEILRSLPELPLWLALVRRANRFRLVLVNGQTGKVVFSPRLTAKAA